MSVDYCDKVYPGTHLPTMENLAEIATILYETEIDTPKSLSFSPDTPSGNKAIQAYQQNINTIRSALGITSSSPFYLWSNNSYSDTRAYSFALFPTRTSLEGGSYNSNGVPLAVCVGD